MSTITWTPKAGTQLLLFSRLWLSFSISRKIKTKSAEPLRGWACLSSSYLGEWSSCGSCSERTICNVVLKMICHTAMQGNLSCIGNPVPWLFSCPLVPCPLSCRCAVPCRVLQRDPASSTLQQQPNLPRTRADTSQMVYATSPFP